MIVLRDIQGRILRMKELNNSTADFQWSASGLAAGLYFVQVDGNTFEVVKK